MRFFFFFHCVLREIFFTIYVFIFSLHFSFHKASKLSRNSFRFAEKIHFMTVRTSLILVASTLSQTYTKLYILSHRIASNNFLSRSFNSLELFSVLSCFILRNKCDVNYSISIHISHMAHFLFFVTMIFHVD